jgi:hypothetical protein
MREKTVELCLRVAASSGCYCYSWNAVVALANTLEEALAITCYVGSVVQQEHMRSSRC